MSRVLVTLQLPDRLDGYYTEVDPERIIGMHQMGNRSETRLTFRDGSSTQVVGTLPEVCRKLYKTKRA